MRITKEHTLTAIHQLPADATIEDALEVLTIFWKVDISLQQDEGMTQREVEQYFQQRGKPAKQMTTDEIIDSILDLPIDERIIIANSLLNTLDQEKPDLTKAWTEEVDRRIKELAKLRILGTSNVE